MLELRSARRASHALVNLKVLTVCPRRCTISLRLPICFVGDPQEGMMYDDQSIELD